MWQGSKLFGRCWVLISALLFAGAVAFAQPKTTAKATGVVDVVQLTSGRSLRGVIAWRDPNGSLTMAISREWLRTGVPSLFPDVLKKNVDQRTQAWTETLDRIDEWLKNAEQNSQLTFFLKQEKERLEKLIADRQPADPGFLWVDLSRDKISKITNATPDQMRIAIHAWTEALSQVETRTAASLEKELTTKGVKLNGVAAEILDWLPARRQSDAEWAARKAVVEYMLVKQIDFQGASGTYVRTGEGQNVNLAEILPNILKSQVGTLLKDLGLNDSAKPPDAKQSLVGLVRQAEAEKCRGFRVTTVEVNPGQFQATVESRFVAQISPNVWKTVWLTRVTEDGTKPRPAAEARIEQDPQFKNVLTAVNSLGIGDAGALSQAVRFGAATMAAQQAADAAIGDFLLHYSRQLDTPPLRPLSD